jgi:hypothetical protein
MKEGRMFLKGRIFLKGRMDGRKDLFEKKVGRIFLKGWKEASFLKGWKEGRKEGRAFLKEGGKDGRKKRRF